MADPAYPLGRWALVPRRRPEQPPPQCRGCAGIGEVNGVACRDCDGTGHRDPEGSGR